MEVTQRKYAEMKGVSRQRVNQWIKTRIITLDPNGKVDVAQADRDLESNLDHLKRMDYDLRIDNPSLRFKEPTKAQKPPPPFTGTLRDWVMMGLGAFYSFFIEEITPMNLSVFKQLKVDTETRRGIAVIFAFKVADLINDFIQKDEFKKWLYDACGEDLDTISKEFFPLTSNVQTTRPGEVIIKHPPIILKLLKDLGPDWPGPPRSTKKKKKKAKRCSTQEELKE